MTDGTTAGTVAVGSSALPPPLGSVQVSGQNLFFAGYDSRAGLELNVVQNSAPTAVNDSASSTDDAAVTVNVVANDTDSDGNINPASVQIASQPAHGRVSVSQSGSVVYTPNAGYAGSDSFTYTDSDNQGATSNPATVTITVTAAKTSSSGGSSGGGSSGGGGGGAMNLFELLVLAGLVVSRRRRVPDRSGVRDHSKRQSRE
jgi:hypothetical protein